MAAPPIINHFEVFKDLLPDLLPRSVEAMLNQFPFHGTEEALDAGVVPAIPLPRHADRDARRCACLLGGEGCILTAAIRMVEETEFGVSSLQGHLQGLLGQLSREPAPQGPAHDGPGIEIQQNGQIESAFHGPDIGEGTRPHLIRSRDGKLPVQLIGGHRERMAGLGGGAPLRDGRGAQPIVPHKPRHAMTPHGSVSRVTQFSPGMVIENSPPR